MKKIWIALIGIMLSACAIKNPPSNTSDICDILNTYPDWHQSALKAEKQWQVPLELMFSIIYQESQFRAKARPPKKRVLGIPTVRPSSAYGYPQALDGTWALYKKDTGHSFAKRHDMESALDFIGWYANQASQRNGVSVLDGYAIYLNYHEGFGGYAQRTYRSKRWLINTARKVERRTDQYISQYMRCFGMRL